MNDFLAILVIPEHVWYIIPAELIVGRGCVTLYPSLEKSKYAPYKEAWHLLRPRPCAIRGTISRIEACAGWTPYPEGAFLRTGDFAQHAAP